jgi:hypothetical protein
MHSIACLLFTTPIISSILYNSTALLRSVQRSHHLGSETTPDKPKKRAVVGLIEIVTTSYLLLATTCD